MIKSLDPGGAEALLLERLRVADHDRFEYAVGWLDPGKRDLVADIERIGLRTYCYGSASVADWRWLRPLRRQLRDDPVDVVHVHSPLMAVGVRTVVRGMGRTRPALITTEHSLGYHWLTRWADAATVGLDDLVIAVSAAVGGARACRRARDTRVVPHGVDVRRLERLRCERGVLAGELGIVDGPCVVSVANFRPEKGHPTLLRAARLVHARIPSANFYLAGQGPLEAWVRAESAAHDMEGYFHVLGRIPDAARLSACGDLFVLSSDWEGRPVALMEALACGVPAVVTAVGGTREMVREGVNGSLVPAGDPGALAAAVLRVLRDAALRDRLSRGALESAAANDIARTASVIERHYARLTGARTGPAARDGTTRCPRYEPCGAEPDSPAWSRRCSR